MTDKDTTSRYTALQKQFVQRFHRPAQALFSAPGRTELGGNHTDHQHGRVLAAAVELDTAAAAAKNNDRILRVESQGYAPCEISLESLQPCPSEHGTTAALVRGVAAGFAALGCPIGGFDACVTSRVMPGSGLSSSAAFEVLVGEIFNDFYCQGRVSAVQIARIGQYAENVYFGKPCGLMDQMACAMGGVVYLDFANPEEPEIQQLPFDFSRCGYGLCILDSGADHADLTADYAAIPAEMGAVARAFDKEVLGQVPEQVFYRRIDDLHRQMGTRPVLRAIHFFEENRRVERQKQALFEQDVEAFLRCAAASGSSSWRLLQNVIPANGETKLAFTLALAEGLLHGTGACRVHGGGFAGTVQAFVPLPMLEEFRSRAEAVLGTGSCHLLSVRRQGACRLTEFPAWQ